MPVVIVGEPVDAPAAFLAGLSQEDRRKVETLMGRWDNHRRTHWVLVPGRSEPEATVSNCPWCWQEFDKRAKAQRESAHA